MIIDPQIDAFIDDEFTQLKAYNAQRPQGHPYAFHLHSMRVAKNLGKLATAMGMDDAYAHTLSRVGLVHDIGKRQLPIAIWDAPGKPDEKTRRARRDHTRLGVEIVDAHFGAENDTPIIRLMRDLMANHHEAVNGAGWLGLRGDDLSIEAKMLCVCDAFDGYSVWRPHYGSRDIRPAAVIRRMHVEKAGQFDTAILTAFAALYDLRIQGTEVV